MTLRHIVMWTLAGDADTKIATAKELAGELEALVGEVPSLQSLTARPSDLRVDNEYDLVLVADFADPEALGEYQVHPNHMAVARKIKDHAVKRAAVDFEV